MAEDAELQERIKKRGGEKLPAGEFEGPASVSRGCTDILCFLIFIAFWAGMFAVASLAIKEGRPDRLWRGYDFDGNTCGEGVNAGKRFVYYPKPPELQYAVCLESCPAEVQVIMCAKSIVTNTSDCPENLRLTSLNSQSVDQIKRIYNCLQNFTTVFQDPTSTQFGWCFPTYPSGPLLIRDGFGRCLPFGLANVANAAYNFSLPTVSGNTTSSEFSYTDLEDVYKDPKLALTVLIGNVAKNYQFILASAGIALLVCILYTQILRFAAGIIAWLTIILFEFVIVALAIVLLFKAGVLDPSKLPSEFQAAIPAAATSSAAWTFKATADQQKVFLAIGIICAVAGVFGLFFIIIMCSRINLAIRVIKEASRAISALPALLVLPIFLWGAIIILFIYWVIILLYLFSAGTFNETTRSYEMSDRLRNCAIYHLFGLLWTRSFILAIGDITMSGSVAQWYWGNKSMLHATTLRAFVRTLRYHIGTAAVGSFIIALVEFIRMVVRYYTNKMKGFEKNSKIIYAIRSCTECCLACLERFLKFASRQAYIQTAMHGTNFFRSAIAAFQLLLRNTLRLAAITVVGHIFIGIGKVFIALVTALIGAIMIVVSTGKGASDVTTADPISVIIIFVLAFAIATGFMAVYET